MQLYFTVVAQDRSKYRNTLMELKKRYSYFTEKLSEVSEVPARLLNCFNLFIINIASGLSEQDSSYSNFKKECL